MFLTVPKYDNNYFTTSFQGIKNEKILRTVLAVLVLSGCSSTGSEDKFSASYLNGHVVENKTTHAEVQSLYGVPDDQTVHSDGTAYWYYDKMAPSIPLQVWPVIFPAPEPFPVRWVWRIPPTVPPALPARPQGKCQVTRSTTAIVYKSVLIKTKLSAAGRVERGSHPPKRAPRRP